ncbi:MAG: nucleotidyltransferase domain-containing protein [Gemmatimonadota bacterium]|nr:nucleotidyltransferase domain-containing protein [Gemmatimonadota bacterium]
MPVPDLNLLSQLQWWLKLPPTNLIERSDHLRFRHALYLMVHQTATVLFGMNGLEEVPSFPSCLSNARVRLDALPVGPIGSGTRLEQVIITEDNTNAWVHASDLIREVVSLADASITPAPALRFRSPHMIRTMAEEVAYQYNGLPGIDAIALSGSLARDMADQGSDVDLSIFCQSPPSESTRWQMLECMGCAKDLFIEPACDTFRIDGTLIHVRFWRSSEVVDMLDALPSMPENLFLAEDLQLCVPLHDRHHRLSGWQSGLRVFPGALITSIIQPALERLDTFNRLWYEAGERRDLIHRYCLACQAVNDWLIALFARNHRFLSTPRWMHRELPCFSFLPDQCEKYLRELVAPISHEDNRWALLGALWESV